MKKYLIVLRNSAQPVNLGTSKSGKQREEEDLIICGLLRRGKENNGVRCQLCRNLLSLNRYLAFRLSWQQIRLIWRQVSHPILSLFAKLYPISFWRVCVCACACVRHIARDESFFHPIARLIYNKLTHIHTHAQKKESQRQYNCKWNFF